MPLVPAASNTAAIEAMVKHLESVGCKVSGYKLSKIGSGAIRVSLSARDRSAEGLVALYNKLEGVHGIELEAIE